MGGAISAYVAYLAASDFDNSKYAQRSSNTIVSPQTTYSGAQEAGAEKVTNGGFDADTNWQKGASWAISGGKAAATAPAASTLLTQFSILISGVAYEVTYTIDSISGGTGARIVVGSAVVGVTRTTAGTYTERLTADGANFSFQAFTSTSVTVDNISVKPLFATFTASGTAAEVNTGGVEALGSDVIVNGGFDSDTTGWADGFNFAGNATFVATGGVARMTITATGPVSPRKVMAMAGLVVGKLYAWAMRVPVASGTGDGFAVVTSASNGTGGETLFQQTLASVTIAPAKSGKFIATATTMYIGVGIVAGTSGATADFDDVTVKEVTNGPIKYFAANVPAIIDTGYVARQALTNQVIQSQTFDNASWLKLNCTATANSVAAPDGTTTADTITESTDGGALEHAPYQSPSLAASTQYTLSLFAKRVNRNISLRVDDANSVTHSCLFDLAGGTAGTPSNATAAIQSLGNGWYRCSITFTTGITAGAGTAYLQSHNGVGVSYVGTGLAAYYLWGATLYAASVAGPYIPTTTASATRGESLLTHNLFADGSALTDQDMLIMVRGTPGEIAGVLVGFVELSTVAAETIQIYANAGIVTGRVVTGSVAVYNASVAGALVAGVEATIVLRRSGGNWRVAKYVAGTLTWAGADTAGGFPTGLPKAVVGNLLGGGSPFRGVIDSGPIIQPGTFATDAAVIAAITGAP